MTKKLKQKPYSFQVDVLKSVSIISVIFLHALPKNILFATQAQFHIWQSVLIFLFLLGFNWGNSYLRTENFWKFIKNRIKRLGIPLIIFTFISMFFQSKLSFDYALFLGTPLFRGPGSYFIAIVIQLIFIIPLMMLVYKRTKAIVFLSIFFVLNLIVEMISLYIFQPLPSIYYSSFSLRYIFLIALGITFIENKNNFLSITYNKIGLTMSLAYLAYWGYDPFYPPYVIQVWKWQHVFTFFYTGTIVYFFIKFLPQAFNRQSILIIGQASFHIFLLQILFFGLNGTKQTFNSIKSIGVNNIYILYGFSLFSVLLITIGGGLLWYLAERKFIWRK